LVNRQRSAEAAAAAAARRADALELDAASQRGEASRYRADAERRVGAYEEAAAQCSGIAAEAERQRDAAQAGTPCSGCDMAAQRQLMLADR
jgi:hypothetical protein